MVVKIYTVSIINLVHNVINVKTCFHVEVLIKFILHHFLTLPF